MALPVDRHAPARHRALQTLTGGIGGLLVPLAHGIGPPRDDQDAWYVICEAPPGPSLFSGLRPWPDSAVIELVLRPIAQVLQELQARGLTHRAIRPNNVFHGAAQAAPRVTGCSGAP